MLPRKLQMRLNDKTTIKQMGNLLCVLILLATLIFSEANNHPSTDALESVHNNQSGPECGYVSLKCCAHHYMEDGECKECKIGTYRLADESQDKCVQCKSEYYGKNCVQMCNCSSIQQCDKAKGCVDKHNATSELKNGMESSTVVASVISVALFAALLLVSVFVYLQFKKNQSKGHPFRRSEALKESKDEEDPYCEIRESALINDLDLHVDGYNHLDIICKRKKINSNTYNENVYFKLENIMATTNEKTTDPNYDKIGNITSH